MKVVRHPLLLLLFVVSLAFLLEGQAQPPAFAAASTPNRLEIARTPGLNNNGGASHEVVLSTQLVRNLYTHTLSLPAAPSDQICPMFLIANYHLTFLHDFSSVLNVNAVDGECHTVNLGNGDVRTGDSTFWTMLHQAQSLGAGQNISVPTKAKQPSTPVKKGGH